MKVYNKELREAVLVWIGEGNTWSELARALGWRRTNGKADTVRVKRCLGLIPTHSVSRNGEKYSYLCRNLNEPNALKIIEAIDRAPTEFDL